MSWLLYAVNSMIAYCFFSVCVKFSLDRVDATLMSTIQTWLTGIILTFITYATCLQPVNQALIDIHKKDWMFIVLSAIAYSASWLFFFFALKEGPLAKIIAIERLDVVVMIFLSAFFFGEQITGKMLIGAALMSLGVFLVTHE